MIYTSSDGWLKTQNLHDRLGSVRQIIDTSGNVKNLYTYKPFGESFATETTENVSNPFKFTGQFFDDEIDQYYLRARQYDPYISRFTTRDPAFGQFEEPLTLHAYLYCGNDSINKMDLNGLWAVDTWLGHQNLTFSAMRDYGFSREDVYVAVMGNITTDFREDHYEAGWAWAGRGTYHPGDIPHYGPSYGIAAQMHAEGALEYAIWLELQGEHESAMHFLGQGTHTIQDRWSHFEQGAGWGPHIPGGANPDDPYEHILEYLCALEETQKYLGRFQLGVERGIYDLDRSGSVGDGYLPGPVREGKWDGIMGIMDVFERRLIAY